MARFRRIRNLPRVARRVGASRWQAALAPQVLGKITKHPGGNTERFGHLFGVYEATQYPGDSWMHSPEIPLRLRSVRIWSDSAAIHGGSSFTFQLYVNGKKVPGFTGVVGSPSWTCDIPGETVIPANSEKVFWSIQAAGNAMEGDFTVVGEVLPG